MTVPLTGEQVLERLADLVAERLAVPRFELVDSAALADRLGVSIDFVRDHQREFGVVKLGTRLAFRWPQCLEAYEAAQAETHRLGGGRSAPAQRPATTGPSAARQTSTRASVPSRVPIRRPQR